MNVAVGVYNKREFCRIYSKREARYLVLNGVVSRFEYSDTQQRERARRGGFPTNSHPMYRECGAESSHLPVAPNFLGVVSLLRWKVVHAGQQCELYTDGGERKSGHFEARALSATGPTLS